MSSRRCRHRHLGARLSASGDPSRAPALFGRRERSCLVDVARKQRHGRRSALHRHDAGLHPAAGQHAPVGHRDRRSRSSLPRDDLPDPRACCTRSSSTSTRLRRVAQLVELAVVNVQQLVASACDFEPCRTQREASAGDRAPRRGSRRRENAASRETPRLASAYLHRAAAARGADVSVGLVARNPAIACAGDAEPGAASAASRRVASWQGQPRSVAGRRSAPSEHSYKSRKSSISPPRSPRESLIRSATAMGSSPHVARLVPPAREDLGGELRAQGDAQSRDWPTTLRRR